MVTVAVAGGTGNVGRTLVEALKESPKHNVIVLARKAPENVDQSVPLFVVDYGNVEEVTKVLEDNSVHTVISTISVLDEVSGQSERSLVAAAAAAGSTKRFVASSWGTETPSDESLRTPFQAARLQTHDALRKTDLEWTEFHNGYFLDYYGMPHVETYMTPITWVLDVPNKTAAIPGTGDDIVTFTYTKDVAKFVVAALDLPAWENGTSLYGDKITWNNFVKLAEANTGSKFNVVFDSEEKLEKGEITELPSHPAVYAHFPKPLMQAILAKFGIYAIKGIFDVPEKGSLNERFPDIVPTKIEEFLSVWKGK